MEPISALLGLGSKVIDRLFPDPEQKAAAMLELQKLQQNGELAKLAADADLAKGQLEINKIEATNESLFVSGWRPAIGWTCGVAFCYHFVLQPLIIFLLAVSGHKIELPIFDMDALNTVLMGMLGFGGLRTFEKYKGVVK